MSVRSHFKVLMDTVHTHHVYHVMISSNVSESETLSLKLHYVTVHKAPKYGAKVPTKYSLSDIIYQNHIMNVKNVHDLLLHGKYEQAHISSLRFYYIIDFAQV